jgi:hypothetical protein
MCWVALDRGIKIAHRYGLAAPLEKWQKERELIKEDILKRGFDRTLHSFVQSYGSKEIDANLLLLALMNFLPFGEERIKGTIEMCQRRLLKDGFLLRYENDDGLKGREGAFIICNFWLIECLVYSGKIEQAKHLLVRTLKAANHLGLFSEEYDFTNKRMLGNFPQGLSHIGFINSIWTIMNMQYKISQKPLRKPLVQKFRKLIPAKIVLNKAERKFSDTNKDIAVQLKIALNNLQGAFFDYAEGRVDYEALKNSDNYKDYEILSQKLNSFDVFSLKTDAEKKAFWINIYNILIIHGVIELDIKRSVKEVFNFFARIGYIIGGFFFSADDIEHGILRKRRPHPGTGLQQFSLFDKRKALCLDRFDPRIHFALVCASSSCPPIEFYDASKIDRQLDIAAKSFINRKGIILDVEKNTVYLSQIFQWYADDFDKNQSAVLKYILHYADEKMKQYVLGNINNIKVQYLPYDWNLNRSLE